LFYPDKNNDDIPDGDPDVLLEGFGLEDTHSVTNSLRWGPDGWLYATQGSTVTGHVKRPGEKKPLPPSPPPRSGEGGERKTAPPLSGSGRGPGGGVAPGDEAVHSMGQLVWRYHPETRRYEIFAEGGGNAFGLEFDAKGRVYSGYNGGDTRGF